MPSRLRGGGLGFGFGLQMGMEMKMGDGAGAGAGAGVGAGGVLPRSKQGTTRHDTSEARLESSESKTRRLDNITSGNLHQVQVRCVCSDRPVSRAARQCREGRACSCWGRLQVGRVSTTRAFPESQGLPVLRSLPSELHRLSMSVHVSVAIALVLLACQRHCFASGNLACPANGLVIRPACAVNCDEDGSREEQHGITRYDDKTRAWPTKYKQLMALQRSPAFLRDEPRAHFPLLTACTPVTRLWKLRLSFPTTKSGLNPLGSPPGLIPIT